MLIFKVPRYVEQQGRCEYILRFNFTGKELSNWGATTLNGMTFSIMIHNITKKTLSIMMPEAECFYGVSKEPR
jgi:hypothetical protein